MANLAFLAADLPGALDAGVKKIEVDYNVGD